MHVAIAGNIGAGKTTLTKLLAKHYNWEPHYESVEENPYLDDFYAEMERWSFNLQVYFLNSRFRQILEIRESGKNLIQDRKSRYSHHIFNGKIANRRRGERLQFGRKRLFKKTFQHGRIDCAHQCTFKKRRL